jgi:hypothetical protein
MSVRFTHRATVVALAASIGLVVLPACKKSKPTDPEPTPSPGTGRSAPGPGPGTGRDPDAPRSPVFYTDNAATRQNTKNNMRQIGLALHNHHDATGSLPAGFADKTGKPGLSWRVAILPYLDQDALFRQFKLDEPWDSDNNKKLIRSMPKIFAPVNEHTNGYTFYRGFTGPGTWLPEQKGMPGRPLRGTTFAHIPDGVSNTILVAEAYDPVIWTKPDELEFAPNKLPKLGGVFDSGTHVIMGDGAVRFIRKGAIDDKTLAKLIQTNDGQIVTLPD